MSQTAIIVPCYNEITRLPKQDFSNFIKLESDFDFYFINDGSTDNTFEMLSSICEKNIGRCKVINLTKNVGKAEAVRVGMLEAANVRKYKYIGFLDADLATPLNELPFLLSILSTKKILLVMGIRLQRLGAKIKRSTTRHYLGRIFGTFASLVLNLPVYDTQCGAKIFASTCINDLFGEPFISKWIFDVEIIARIRKMIGEQSKEQIYEFPLNIWEEKGGSKVHFKSMIIVPFELFKIYRKYKN